MLSSSDSIANHEFVVKDGHLIKKEDIKNTTKINQLSNNSTDKPPIPFKPKQ
jgi:hypothetical protein